eukprot:5619977-Prymnesium_polylepis.1
MAYHSGAQLNLRVRVVIFAPNYWHITRSCRNSEMLPSAAEYSHAWAPWMRDTTVCNMARCTLVSAPLENVPSTTPDAGSGRPGRSMAKAGAVLNKRLRKLFEPGLNSSFEFADFSGLTATLQPDSVGESGGTRSAHGRNAYVTSDQARDRRPSWHYVCLVSNWRDFATEAQQQSATGSAHRRLVIAQHVSRSGCAEGGNTPLWRMLLGLDSQAARRFVYPSDVLQDPKGELSSLPIQHHVALMRDGDPAWRAARSFLRSLKNGHPKEGDPKRGSIIDVGANTGGWGAAMLVVARHMHIPPSR